MKPTVEGIGSIAELNGLLDGLVQANVEQMKRVPFPKLYNTAVRYRREKRDANGKRLEQWRTARAVMRAKGGDCEDLAAFRAAELRVSGEDRKARAVAVRSGMGMLHAVVKRGDNTYEDPSKRLGMRGRA